MCPVMAGKKCWIVKDEINDMRSVLQEMGAAPLLLDECVCLQKKMLIVSDGDVPCTDSWQD